MTTGISCKSVCKEVAISYLVRSVSAGIGAGLVSGWEEPAAVGASVAGAAMGLFTTCDWVSQWVFSRCSRPSVLRVAAFVPAFFAASGAGSWAAGSDSSLHEYVTSLGFTAATFALTFPALKAGRVFIDYCRKEKPPKPTLYVPEYPTYDSVEMSRKAAAEELDLELAEKA